MPTSICRSVRLTPLGKQYVADMRLRRPELVIEPQPTTVNILNETWFDAPPRPERHSRRYQQPKPETGWNYCASCRVYSTSASCWMCRRVGG